MRTILLGITLAIFNAVVSFIVPIGFSALDIPPQYNILFQYIDTFIIFFLGARYVGKGVFYPALITHIFLLLFATFLMANNLFLVSAEYSESFLTTLSRRYVWLLFEVVLVIVALLLGIFNRKHRKGK